MRSPQTHILLTVGKNPIPCVVGAARVIETCNSSGTRPSVIAIGAPDANRREPLEIAAIRNALAKRFTGGEASWAMPWLLSNAYDPKGILGYTREKLLDIPAEDMVHFHYTGGTKAMAIPTMEALRTRPPERLQISYLDGALHRVVTDNGLLAETIDDERQDWHMSVGELATLHNVEILDTYALVSAEEAEAAGELFEALLEPSCWERFREWEQGYRKKFRNNQLEGVRERDLPGQPVEWPIFRTLDWDKTTRRVQASIAPNLLKQSLNAWVLDFSNIDLASVHRFNRLTSPAKLLELNTHRILRKALGDHGRSSDDSRHSVVIRRGGVTAELDVLAVVGYQLLNVSCTVSADRKEAKLKAFEALHRARQLGGDGARAIVLCRLDANAAWQLEQDLQDDPGTVETPLRIWGLDQWDRLYQSFSEYFQRDLTWTTPENA